MLTHNEAVKYALQQKKNDVDYSNIKRKFNKAGLTQEQIKAIIQQTDDELLNSIINSKKEPFVKVNNKFFGVALIASGVFITLFTYTGILNLGDYYLIVYGPVFAGIGLLSYDKKKKLNNKRKPFDSPYNKWRERK